VKDPGPSVPLAAIRAACALLGRGDVRRGLGQLHRATEAARPRPPVPEGQLDLWPAPTARPRAAPKLASGPRCPGCGGRSKVHRCYCKRCMDRVRDGTPVDLESWPTPADEEHLRRVLPGSFMETERRRK